MMELVVTFTDGRARVVAQDANDELGKRRLDRLAFKFLNRGEVERCTVQTASGDGRGKYRRR